MKTILLWILFPILALGQIISPSEIRTYKSLKNYVINPDAEYNNKAGITDFSSILTLNSTAPIDGKYQFQIDGTASGQKVKFKLRDLPEKFVQGQGEANFQYFAQSTATNGDYKFYIENSSGTVVSDIGYVTKTPNINLSQTIRFSEPLVSIQNPYYLVFESTVASPESILVDDIYGGDATGIVTVSAMSDETSAETLTIGAVTTAPTKGTTTKDSVTWHREGQFAVITYKYAQSAGSGNAGSGDYLFSLPSSLIANTTLTGTYTGANIYSQSHLGVATSNGSITSTTGPVAGSIGPAVMYNSTQFRIIANAWFSNGNNAISSGLYPLTQAIGFSFTIKVPIQGWSANASAAAANQTDYGWTAYTPTFTGFGTPTSVECFHSRKAQNLLVRCKFVAGTTTATEARVSLPNSLSIGPSSIVPSIVVVGKGAGSGAISSDFGGKTVLATAGNSYFTFGNHNSTSGSATASQNGNAVCGTGATFEFNASIPIDGWTENQRAPTLLGSVTSNSTSALRIESASITSGGVVTELGSSDWLNGNCSASAPYVCTFNSGVFSGAPVCQTTANSDQKQPYISAISSSSVSVDTYTTSTLARANGGFYLTCMGPR